MDTNAIQKTTYLSVVKKIIDGEMNEKEILDLLNKNSTLSTSDIQKLEMALSQTRETRKKLRNIRENFRIKHPLLARNWDLEISNKKVKVE